MRWIFSWPLWLLLALPTLAQSLPDPGPLIAEVLATHPSVRKAQHGVAAAEATLSGSRSQPNPTLTLAATAGDAGEDSNALTQTFEISGQPRLRHEQAQAQLESARLQLRWARRQVAGTVCADWLEIWESQHLAMLARLRLDLMNDMVRVGRRRYEVGEIPQNESLRVELAAAEAEADWKRAEAAYASAQRSLGLLRGLLKEEMPALDPLPPDSAMVVFDPPSLTSTQAPWSLEQVLAGAEGHFQVEAIRQEQKATLLAAELLGKERAPQLGVSLYRSEFFGTNIEQGAQLFVSWPLFDWGSLSARKRAQLSQAEAKLAEADEKVLELRRQVAGLWNDWQASQAVRAILEVQAKRYEELAREARVGYDLGLLTLTDVLQTETSFRQAGVDLIKVQAEVYRLELGLLEHTNLPWPSHLLEEP
jgi:outer membrane protein TolC